MVLFTHQKYFIKEAGYYYSCLVVGEITTEVVKMTHPNEDQVGIIHVCFSSGSMVLSIES